MCRFQQVAHTARSVSRTSRGAALRDAGSRRPLSARPILSGASQSVRWAQHAPRLGLSSRSALALSHARQRGYRVCFPSRPRPILSASPSVSSRSSCRRSMTGRRQNSHGGRWSWPGQNGEPSRGLASATARRTSRCEVMRSSACRPSLRLLVTFLLRFVHLDRRYSPGTSKWNKIGKRARAKHPGGQLLAVCIRT